MQKVYNKIASTLSPAIVNHYEQKERKALKNSNFTILCSNCIGGIIYNRLGQRFLSPTINMWQTQRDFIKLAINPRYYMEQPLEFIKSNESTPVAKCGDIILHFNHSKTSEDAEHDWNKRKIRSNYDNIYIIFYYRDGYSIEEIREIEKANCKNLIILTSKPLPLNYAKVIEPNLQNPNGDSFIDSDIFGIRTFEKQWDFVSWLNSTKQF